MPSPEISETMNKVVINTLNTPSELTDNGKQMRTKKICAPTPSKAGGIPSYNKADSELLSESPFGQ